MTSSNGNIFRVTGHLCGNSPVTGEFPTQGPVTRSFDVFFHLRLNKRLSIQSWGWWFETLLRPLWRHSNAQTRCVAIHAVNSTGNRLSEIFMSHKHSVFTVIFAQWNVRRADYIAHYSDVTCAAWRFKSPATLLFVRRIERKHQMPTLPALCEGSPRERYIALPNRQSCGKRFHVMTSSCHNLPSTVIFVRCVFTPLWAHSVQVKINIWDNMNKSCPTLIPPISDALLSANRHPSYI